jgi:hypothetical protein
LHATAHEATTAALLAAPPVNRCAPWCRDGNGHIGGRGGDAFYADDQYCISEPRTIELKNLPLVPWSDGRLRRQTASVYLLREHEARSTTVEVSLRDEPIATLALDDALDLSRAILDAVMAARA